MDFEFDCVSESEQTTDDASNDQYWPVLIAIFIFSAVLGVGYILAKLYNKNREVKQQKRQGAMNMKELQGMQLESMKAAATEQTDLEAAQRNLSSENAHHDSTKS